MIKNSIKKRLKKVIFLGVKKRSDCSTIGDKIKVIPYYKSKKVKKTEGLSRGQVWKRCYSICFEGYKKREQKSYFKGFLRGFKAYLKNILKKRDFAQKFDVCFWTFNKKEVI